MANQSFHELFVDQLRDLYDAEQQITRALPGVIEAVTDEDLRQALENHLELTSGHVERLDQIFGELGETATGKTCKGMQGLLKEGEEAIGEQTGGFPLDALIIAEAQRVEHYEIAGYGTARTWAGELGLDQAVDLLDETLDEEAAADEKLTSIATGGLISEGVNPKAAAR